MGAMREFKMRVVGSFDFKVDAVRCARELREVGQEVKVVQGWRDEEIVFDVVESEPVNS